MLESYRETIEEFKRVDHLFYVTLKYTRTVDVIRSMLERLVTTYEYALLTILKVLKEEQQIEDIPNNPVGQAVLVKEKGGEEQINQYIDIYLNIRKILRLPYTKSEEFRRHVTMTVVFNEEEMGIDIDLLKEYYDYTREVLTYVKSLVEKYRE